MSALAEAIDAIAAADDRIERLERGRRLVPNQGLHAAADAIVLAHPWGLQYLEAAPVLALCVPNANKAREKAVRAMIAYHLQPLCARGAPLREVMETFHLAYPLRRLGGFALAPGYADVVLAISKASPAVIGRIVPEKPAAQKRWLAACAAWRMRMLLHRLPRDTRFLWAAEAMSKAGVARGDVDHVADFAVRRDARFSEAWGWGRAASEAHAWHARITLESALKGTPFTAETVIDLGPHPNVAFNDGYQFVALRTPLALHEEGSAMRHCVATYLNQVAGGWSRIVSMRLDGKRVATIEMDKHWQVQQLRRKANAAPSVAERNAALRYAFSVKQQVWKASEARRRGDAP